MEACYWLEHSEPTAPKSGFELGFGNSSAGSESSCCWLFPAGLFVGCSDSDDYLMSSDWPSLKCHSVCRSILRKYPEGFPTRSTVFGMFLQACAKKVGDKCCFPMFKKDWNERNNTLCWEKRQELWLIELICVCSGALMLWR